MTYSEKLRDPRWQSRRKSIIESAGNSCEDCKRKDVKLEVHHCYYKPRGEPWEVGINCLMALCSECHKTRQKAEDYFRLVCGMMFRRIPVYAVEALGSFMTASTLKMEGFKHKESGPPP